MKAGAERAKILLVGMAYKKNVDDMCASPSLVLTAELLEAEGARKCHISDPFVPVIPLSREHMNWQAGAALSLPDEAQLAAFD